MAGVAWAPGALLDAFKGEASLWKQEAELYGRRASEAVSEATGVSSSAADAAATATAGLELDASLAEALLQAPLTALMQGGSSSGAPAASLPPPPQLPRLDEERYQRDYQALLQQELPYFRDAGACGHCGGNAGASALADRSYFDFLSYVSFKALVGQIGPQLAASSGAAAGPETLSGWERM